MFNKDELEEAPNPEKYLPSHEILNVLDMKCNTHSRKISNSLLRQKV